MLNVIKLSTISPDQCLYGIMHWVQYYAAIPTNRTVFKYVSTDIDFHYFRSLDGKNFISKKDAELGRNGFRPFCIDHKRIETWLESTQK